MITDLQNISAMRVLLLLLIGLLFSCETTKDKELKDLATTFENSGGTETATYEEVTTHYLKLAQDYPEINVQTIGSTDSGYPLHLVTFNPDGNFNFKKLKKEKVLVLINNGIHPGESDGIDAAMLLFRDLAVGKIKPPKNVVVATVAVYNVGGMLNRNSNTRANQNGPKSYGFRGNARNYDLNRDFIKTDTKNAATFTQIYHLVSPDIFVDTHVSNGADYQYTLTHLFTQHNKLGGKAGTYLHEQLMPNLENALKDRNWDITPYVNVFNTPPEQGFQQFLDSPRYSTGYTTLFNTLGMMVETHMLKPYKQRVEGTYELLTQLLKLAQQDHKEIKALGIEADIHHKTLEQYHLNWQVDTTRTSILAFKGFKADTITSAVTGKPRLTYQRDQPFTKNVIYNNYYVPKDTVEVPQAYVIKKEWTKVMERLSLNEIDFFEIPKDTSLTLEAYRIKDYNTVSNPYEGHYLHYGTTVTRSQKRIQLNKGDIVVPTDQKGIRYLLETLEPHGPDSFFNWNFFDTILQQKEGFSAYVFEDTAKTLLKNNDTLRELFLLKKQNDTAFAENAYMQLNWLYQRSPNYESAHMQYPIYRIPKGSQIDLTLGN